MEWEHVEGIGLMLLIGALYLWPLTEALASRHFAVGRIAAVNVLLGWTLIGWVVALRMALAPSVGRCPWCGREHSESAP